MRLWSVAVFEVNLKIIYFILGVIGDKTNCLYLIKVFTIYSKSEHLAGKRMLFPHYYGISLMRNEKQYITIQIVCKTIQNEYNQTKINHRMKSTLI